MVQQLTFSGVRRAFQALALATCSTGAAAQTPPLRITLEVIAPALPDSIPIYATGSHPALGNWNPAGFKLASQGNHVWRGTLTVDRAMSLEYKFTLGIWEREAADSAGAPFSNITARVTSDTLLRTRVGNWTSGARPRVLDGQVTGTLRFHRAVAETRAPSASAASATTPAPLAAPLAARDVVVWLPPGYDAESARRYPVLYMFDGQNLFDPATSSMGVDWAIDEAADSLIRAGTIPPMIDATYRTRREAASTWVGGASAGGIAAFMLVWERPDVFSRALAFSPAFQSPAGLGLTFDYLPNVRRTAQPPRGVRFYMDMGGVGLDDQLRPGTDTLLTLLRERGYRDEVDLKFVADLAAEHNERAWRRRFPAALVWMLR